MAAKRRVELVGQGPKRRRTSRHGRRIPRLTEVVRRALDAPAEPVTLTAWHGGGTADPKAHEFQRARGDRRMPKPKDRLLTVDEVADRLGTTVYFPRRLIAERR